MGQDATTMVGRTHPVSAATVATRTRVAQTTCIRVEVAKSQIVKIALRDRGRVSCSALGLIVVAVQERLDTTSVSSAARMP